MGRLECLVRTAATARVEHNARVRHAAVSFLKRKPRAVRTRFALKATRYANEATEGSECNEGSGGTVGLQ